MYKLKHVNRADFSDLTIIRYKLNGYIINVMRQSVFTLGGYIFIIGEIESNCN